MAYDGDGNRVSGTVGGVTTKYLVDSLNPTGYAQVIDELVGGAVTRTYAYGLQRISENQQIGGAWTPSFYGYDGHGNVRFLMNSSGAVTDSYTYDAFGLPLTTTGTTPNNFLYSGEQYDSALGLYYLRSRYYNPATGRFLSRDSEDGNAFDPQTLHKYLYVGANPVNASDPTGKGIIEDTFVRIKSFARTVIEGTRIGESVLCYIKFTTDVTDYLFAAFLTRNPFGMRDIAYAYEDLRACLELSSLF
jgi:RHS repeat-associated protein